MCGSDQHEAAPSPARQAYEAELERQDAAAQRRSLVERLTPDLEQAMRDPMGPGPAAIAMLVNVADRDHIDAARARSVELAVQRGHLRRG